MFLFAVYRDLCFWSVGVIFTRELKKYIKVNLFEEEEKSIMEKSTENKDVDDKTVQINGTCKSLETKDEEKARYKSLYIVYFTLFLQSLGLAIAMTGIWPYLNKVSFVYSNST